MKAEAEKRWHYARVTASLGTRGTGWSAGSASSTPALPSVMGVENKAKTAEVGPVVGGPPGRGVEYRGRPPRSSPAARAGRRSCARAKPGCCTRRGQSFSQRAPHCRPLQPDVAPLTTPCRALACPHCTSLSFANISAPIDAEPNADPEHWEKNKTAQEYAKTIQVQQTGELDQSGNGADRGRSGKRYVVRGSKEEAARKAGAKGAGDKSGPEFVRGLFSRNRR